MAAGISVRWALQIANTMEGDPVTAALAAEVRRLYGLADDVRSAWVEMPPAPRHTVRLQSNELYDALGALSTQIGDLDGAR